MIQSLRHSILLRLHLWSDLNNRFCFPNKPILSLPVFSGQHGGQVAENKTTDQDKCDQYNLGHGDGPKEKVQGRNMSVLNQDD